MASLKKNIIANFAGSGWTALANIVFIPVYIHFIGIEAYGLIGFFAMLQGLCAVLDIGLSATINRELARLSAMGGKRREMRELTRTLEVFYWTIALAIMLVIILAAPLIADKWLNSASIGREAVRQCVILMGIGLFFRWPLSFYFGGLMGLQRQVAFNAVKVFAETIRSVGVILALWFIAPTIQVFFVWQILVGFGYTLALIALLWRSLDTGFFSTKPNASLLRDVKHFAMGMSGISLTVVALTHMDKVILSKLLPLKEFGYYALASSVAVGMYQIISPVFYAIYPRFTQLVTIGDRNELVRLYHASSQFMSLLLLPISACIIINAEEILLLWTRNVETSQHTHLILSLLVAGTALNGLMNMPYAIQIAHAWTRLTLFTNLAAIVVLGPLILIMSVKFGAVGAAVAWLILNCGYVAIVPHIMHGSILNGEKWRWYWSDLTIPLIVSFAVVLAARQIVPAGAFPFVMVGNLVLPVLCALTLSAASLPYMRRWLQDKFASLRCS